MSEKKTVITLICERAADVNSLLTQDGALKELPDVHVIKLPCSGMIQPNMIEHAMKNGAEGVIVCGCQIGDCYYREGNKWIRERLLGERPPGLKKTVDRRRVVALWLSRVQRERFISEAKEFIARIGNLPSLEPAKAATPAAKPIPNPQAVKAPAEGAKEETKAAVEANMRGESPAEKASEGSAEKEGQ